MPRGCEIARRPRLAFRSSCSTRSRPGSPSRCSHRKGANNPPFCLQRPAFCRLILKRYAKARGCVIDTDAVAKSLLWMFLAEGGLARRGQRGIEGVAARHLASGGRPRTRNALRHADQPPRHGRHAPGQGEPHGRPGAVREFAWSAPAPERPAPTPAAVSNSTTRADKLKAKQDLDPVQGRSLAAPAFSKMLKRGGPAAGEVSAVRRCEGRRGAGHGQGAGVPLQRLVRLGHAGHHPAGYHHHARDQLVHSPHR